MEYRKLGVTDIKVSLLCLGTMTWGNQNTEAEAHAQMDYAVEQGINFFDTAEMYAVPPTAESCGKTEEFIGTWFKKTGKRKDVVLATKVAGPAPSFPWIRNGKARLEPSQIIEACDGSLKRLQTDHIDLYQVHWPERPLNIFGTMDYPETDVTGREADQIFETLDTLDGLVRSGKIRHVGVSNETPWGLMTYLEFYEEKNLPRVQSIQNPYNLLNRTFDIGLSEIALQESVGLLAYSPLGGGTLTGKYLDGKIPPGSRRAVDARGAGGRGGRYLRPRVDEAVRAYQAVAKKHGLDPVQMAIAFVNAKPFVTSNIIGATSMEQLKTNIASIHVKLTPEALKDIDAVHFQTPNPCP